jgi:hypothetical protein
MVESLLGRVALLLGTAVSLVAFVWLSGLSQKPPNWLGIVTASSAVLLFWPAIIGFLSRTRMWSLPWTLLAGAMPFWTLAIWIFFFSRLAMQMRPGFEITLVLVCFGSGSGRLARKKAYPQFRDEDSPSASLPPPTLFPK